MLDKPFKIAITLLLTACIQKTFALSVEEQLKLVIKLYALKPTSCEQSSTVVNERLAIVGEALFNSTVVSGDGDVSCSSCHLDEKELTDGLPIAVGVGRDSRNENSITLDSVLVPRNAFTLFGRAHEDFSTFFWDGKVMSDGKQIYSPIGEGRSQGFNSPLSVAAVLPLLARDEFLGKQSYFDNSEQLDTIEIEYYEGRLKAANEVFIRLLGRSDENSKRLKAKFDSAGIENPTLVEAGNALAAFIAKKNTPCIPSPWEKYLSGDTFAISDRQKTGAITFFGKGRCAACHSGALFSDFKFHSLGLPQGNIGPYMHGQDTGRAMVTYALEDRFQFRTPPLIRVSKTGPYGHNGEFSSLKDIVLYQ